MDEMEEDDGDDHDDDKAGRNDASDGDDGDTNRHWWNSAIDAGKEEHHQITSIPGVHRTIEAAQVTEHADNLYEFGEDARNFVSGVDRGPWMLCMAWARRKFMSVGC